MSIKEVEEESGIDHFPKSSQKAPIIRNKKRKLVILFTYYRSGSTFTGQLLNQHSDVFYLFEPLILGITENENIQSKIDVLNRIANCSLPNFDEFSTSETPEHVKQSCQFRNFCFPHGTKEFCAPPFCHKDLTEDRKVCGHISNQYCPGPAILRQEATDLCNSKKIVALKTIRIMAIEQFVDYFKQLESEGHSLQLIFLVRDPRGIFNSRLRIAKIQYHDTKKTDDLVRVLNKHFHCSIL